MSAAGKTGEHTPTPWTLSGDYIFSGDIAIPIASAHKEWATVRAGYLHGQAQANAAFIVRAVNSHDALVEMVKLFEQSAEYQIRVATNKGDDEGARLMGFTLHLIREALALASPSLTTAERSA